MQDVIIFVVNVPAIQLHHKSVVSVKLALNFSESIPMMVTDLSIKISL